MYIVQIIVLGAREKIKEYNIFLSKIFTQDGWWLLVVDAVDYLPYWLFVLKVAAEQLYAGPAIRYFLYSFHLPWTVTQQTAGTGQAWQGPTI